MSHAYLSSKSRVILPTSFCQCRLHTCVCIYVCMYLPTCMCLGTRPMYLYTMYVCICICMYVRMYVYVYMYVCVYVCMNVCMYVYTSLCTQCNIISWHFINNNNNNNNNSVITITSPE